MDQYIIHTMSKLVFALLFPVVIAAVAEASTRTIVTTATFEDDTDPSSRQMGVKCGQEMMDQQMLNHCQMYLMTSTGKSSGPAKRMDLAEEHLPLCCMQLENMDKKCMCEGIKMMMNQLPWTQQEMMGQMMDMAMNLPKTCKLANEQCQMRAIWF